MRTRAAIASILSSVAVLAIGWDLGTQASGAQLPSNTAATSTGGSGASTPSRSPSTSGAGSNDSRSRSGSGTSAGSSSSGSSGSSAKSGSSGSSGKDGSFTGSAVGTPYGTVQVTVSVSGGKITEVTPDSLTGPDGRSRMISNYAAPILRKEVLQAQSANVSIVSGATFTSVAYLRSAQAALSQAGL